jgi:hypothetical protein
VTAWEASISTVVAGSLMRSFTGALGHARLGHWHLRSCRHD